MPDADLLDVPASDPVPTQNLHDHVISSLRSMVMHGELVEGRRVPEAWLCERLGISRTPLREALKVLAAEGFVALRPNRGAVVVPIDPRAVAELFELKSALERLIGLNLPDRIRDSERLIVEDIHRALGAAMLAGDIVAYTRLNHEFHGALAAAVHNDALTHTYGGLQQKILRARYAVNSDPGQLRRSMREHNEIVAMLRAGAALDLAQRLEEHNRRTGEAIIRDLTTRATAVPC